MFAKIQLGLLSLLGMTLIVIASIPSMQFSRRQLPPLADFKRANAHS